MDALAEARARIVELEIEIAKTRLSGELAEAMLVAAEERARSEKLAKRCEELEFALGRRTSIRESANRGLRRLVDRNGDG